MKKSMWIKIGIFGAVVVAFTIYFIVSIIHNNKIENSPLTNCAYYEYVETNKVKIMGRVFVLPLGVAGGEYRSGGYSIEQDSIVLTYDTDPDTRVLLTTYENPENLDITLKDTYLSVTYLEDQNTSLDKQVSDFYDSMLEEEGYTFTKTEETTWEDVSRYFYLAANPKGSVEDCYFDSYDWDIDVWHFVLKDENKNAMLDVLFFERADGFYRIDMCYPENDKDAKESVYEDFGYISFNTDSEKIEDMNENIVVTESIQSDGSLIVTVVNNSEHTIESLRCNLSTYYTQDDKEIPGSSHSIREANIDPGSIVTFTFEADLLEDTSRYTVSAAVLPFTRYLDEEGVIHNSENSVPYMTSVSYN